MYVCMLWYGHGHGPRQAGRDNPRLDLVLRPQKLDLILHSESQKCIKNYPRPDLGLKPQKRDQNLHLQSKKCTKKPPKT